MYCLYVLYSQKIDRYYVGQSKDIKARIELHREKAFSRSYTKRADDWILKREIEFATRSQALNAEKLIKRRKSGKFLEKLIASDQEAESFKRKVIEAVRSR